MPQNKLIFLFFLLVFLFNIQICSAQEPRVIHKDGFYILKLNLSKYKIEPYVSNKLETVYDIARKTNADAVINTGFFDGKNQKSVSFITKNEETLANPKENQNLTTNKELQTYLPNIYNRAELRIMNCDGKMTADITKHFDSTRNDCKILSSTQAGPMLLPKMDLEGEFFVLKKNGKTIRDGASMTRKTARSMAAIKGKNIYFIITDEQTPLTIYELQEKISKYNFDKAINFDGGGSVSLFVKTQKGEFYQAREKNNTSRPIKSALLIFANKKEGN